MSPPWARVHSTSKRSIRDGGDHFLEASAEGKKDPGRQGMVGKGANKMMNVGIPHKVLDYWRQLKREYIQETRLASCGPRTSRTDLDSRYYQAIVRWRWMDAPTVLFSGVSPKWTPTSRRPSNRGKAILDREGPHSEQPFPLRATCKLDSRWHRRNTNRIKNQCRLSA
jgi:hypothetical protein